MVEDDQNFGAVMKSYLQIHDFDVDWINDGAIAVDEFKRNHYDICILDIMLPNKDGFTIAEEIRSINKEIPLIFLTAKTLKKDILQGFELGADDYITKPFDSEVLLCKINAILKRNKDQQTGNPDQMQFSIGKFSFDADNRTVVFEKISVKLSPKESELLRLLCVYMNKVLPRDLALRTIWGDPNYFTTRSMDVFISKLRKILSKDPDIEIINIHGSGYRLNVKVN